MADRPCYPLRSLLDLRRLLEQRREQQLVDCRRALEALERRASQCEEQQQQAREDLHRARPPEGELVEIRRFRGAEAHRRRLRQVLCRRAEQCGALQVELGRARLAVDRALEALAEARRSLEAVQRHRRAWDRRRQRAEFQRTEADLEQLVAARTPREP